MARRQRGDPACGSNSGGESVWLGRDQGHPGCVQHCKGEGVARPMGVARLGQSVYPLGLPTATAPVGPRPAAPFDGLLSTLAAACVEPGACAWGSTHWPARQTDGGPSAFTPPAAAAPAPPGRRKPVQFDRRWAAPNPSSFLTLTRCGRARRRRRGRAGQEQAAQDGQVSAGQVV